MLTTLQDPPAGTLSALTAAASGRLLFAGALPLVILQFFTAVTPRWALYIFGFISLLMLSIPFVLFHWGPTFRAKSRYSRMEVVEPMEMGMPARPSSQDGLMQRGSME